ncbi:MAG: hypothetical protein BMS9Abin05_0768 [Rhodothermia bacterium]|nr:MAG: hypothetical protein BMS9Abin05_0768 [Rhodothermia bacterium]
MRQGTALLSVLFLVFIVSACDDSRDYERDNDGEYISEEIHDQIEDVGETLERKREKLQERLEEAEETIREELEEFEGDETITKEELEELQDRMHESARRIRDELKDSEEDFELAMQDLGSALEQIGNALKEDADIEPVPYRKLRDLLPHKVAGMARYDTDGSSSSVLGIRVSKIEGKYEGDRNDMSIAIMDLGSISGVAALGMDFIDARIDREYRGRFEKTTEINGYPAFVEVEDRGRGQRYSALIMVADRFMIAIEAEGRDLDRDIIEEVVDRISLRRLKRLARY